MEIKSKDIELVDINLLVPYKKNMNKHTDEQIDRLIELIKYQGFRDPIIAQKGTNIIAAGHGRVEAAKKMGLEKVPVSYQEFANEEQFYSFVVSHNAINAAQWGGGLDFSKINVDIQELGPDLNIDLLGIKDFQIEPLDAIDVDEEYEGREKFDTEIDECSDYILLMFKNKKKFEAACKYFKIESELLQCGHSESEGMQIMMLPRIVEMDKHEF